ncbi:MAG: protein translocase subunit SecD [Fimbriimonas sp.]
MRSKSYLFLLLVLGLGILSGIIYSKTQYHYGLDVKGGIRLTYQMELNAEQRQKAEEHRSKLIAILMRRASGSMGVVEPIIVPKGEDQIIVELPGATDIEDARKIIGTSARIEFYHAKNVATDTSPFRPYDDVERKDTTPTVSFKRTSSSTGQIDFRTSDGKVNPEYTKIIKGWGEPILAGEDLAKADAQPSGNSTQPLMLFSREGSKKMEAWSRKFFGRGEKIASVLDGEVLSIAPVEKGALLSDNAVINGTFDRAYVRRLVDLLNAGALPVKMTELGSEKIDPTIGNYALDKMVTAGLAAFGVTALFLIAYYAFPGFVALLALCLYILFTLTVLKLAGATFSLASIAGFILSIGMAVDANILVFERLKEEMKSGKSLMSAIDLGFRRAFPAIVDSNACTILTSLVLLVLGTGPVKGFATTLIIGVLISLFTAITVTRSLLVFFAASGIATNPKWYAADRNWMGKKMDERANEKPFRIVETSKRWFAISIISMLVTIPFFFMGGFKLNVEFQGGYEVSYPAPANMNAPQITENLEKAGFKGANVKMGEAAGGQRRVFITVPESPKLADTKTPSKLIAEAAQVPITSETTDSFTKIGPAIQQETVRNAILGVIISSLLIVVYLAFRFGTGFGGFSAGLRFAFSAIAALLHDIVVVIGAAAVLGYFLGWEISALFLTAMLTVIGFSVHDTIVIFDRIRENLHRQRQSEDFGHLIDRSITQSFARSINTSATVVATLAIMLIMGTSTPDLKLFVAAMLIGIASGTYSSIYNASPILYLVDKMMMKKRGDDHSLVSIAVKDFQRQRTLATTVETPAVINQETGRSYGQVKRRANADKKGHIEIEED